MRAQHVTTTQGFVLIRVPSRFFWIGAAAILVVAAVIAITAIVGGDFSTTDGKILLTLGMLLLAGATAFAGLALVERRVATGIGRASVAIAGVGFVLVLVTIWTESDSLARPAGTAAIAIVAMLLATTNRLLIRDQRVIPLWGGTVAVLVVATLLTATAIWAEDAGSGLGKAIAAFWILGVLGWFLVPVSQRLTKAGLVPPNEPIAERVIATLDGVDVLATAKAAEGDVVIDASAAAPGNQLVLRRRP